MELEQMWECRKSKKHTIVPIFYDVSPSDVKDQAGDFKTSFDQHAKDGVDGDTIKKWKEVLGEVGKLAGHERANINGGYESKLLKVVLKCVMEVLKKDDQRVTDKLVGIDHHVRKMMTKLGVVCSHGQATKVCGEDVRVVGIWGLPGVGKTTLAKVVYNKIHNLFDGCSFVEVKNLRGVSNQDIIIKEEVKLSQELLIADLQKEKLEQLRSYDKGIEIIGSAFTKVNVLIVLDDVHKDEQIEGLVGELTWFGPGSRIIVTSDKKDVLHRFADEAVKEHWVEPMIFPDAFQLLCKHALQGSGIAPQDVYEYEFLSMAIVEATGGLPLAIKVAGSYLYKNSKDIQIWRSYLERLTNHQDNTVKATFKVSYEFLDDATKEIFLDIACFFNGKDERIPSYMWKSCNFFPPMGIKLLRDMCLLEIGENNELKMHALLRNFGRKHVEGKDLHKRCRFWNPRDARFIPEDGEGTGSVECIGLTVREGRTVPFTCENFCKMLNLRYLGLDRANIRGNTENLPPDLKWLDWRGCHFIPDLRNMHLKKLVILDLSRSPVTKDSNVWSQIIEKVKELKVLNLQGCDLLGTSLKFSVKIDLEILILEDCVQLYDIGTFISGLGRLKSLNLRNCERVWQLPQELHCMNFLTELLIDGTGVKKIYIPNDSLTTLEKLSACRCENLEDISPIGHLRELKSLALDGAIKWCPKAFEFPPNLQRLSLRNCGMFQELPPSIGKLKELVVVDLSDTMITELPESVKDLRNLKTLKMERTHLKKFPEDIVKLAKLEEIDFSRCKSLEGQVRCDISGLSSLRIFRLSSSNVAGLPQSICHLSCLQTLDVGKCRQLRALPELPSSLVTLCWGSEIMGVPELTNLTNLKELCLNHDEQPEAGSLNQTPNIEWVMGLTSLETLELSLPNVTNLPSDFSALTQLRELTLSYMKELDLTQLPSSSSLWTLRLKHCKIQEPKFSSLKHISELELEDCDLAEIDGLEDLKCLQVLKISRCKGITNLNGLEKIGRLRMVRVLASPQVVLPKLLKCVVVDRCDR
ncbi:hypothetical protein EUGRSUZ_C02640 [Eucalyptus grandis]|uniref:Uncharacterized protein n=1 Tax=Eucalyptus grandis TaxID=71139 RepID=A0ACC3LGI7_EUCGR|nr:hypothetical protein EUGRSUZ_C02640 [Eucalyptus grandis]